MSGRGWASCSGVIGPEAERPEPGITPIGSAVSAIPPGCAEGGWIGEGLLGADDMTDDDIRGEELFPAGGRLLE